MRAEVAVLSGFIEDSFTGTHFRSPNATNAPRPIIPTPEATRWFRRNCLLVRRKRPLDSVGPMARSASDAAATLGVVAGSDSNDPTTLKASVPNYANQISDDIRGLRIGVDRAFATGEVHEEVVAALSETEVAFIELGADVREVTVPFSDRISDIFLVLCSTEAAAAHKETYPVHASEYGNELAELIERGRKTSALQLAESLQERVRLGDSVSTMFREIDLLLTPTLPFPVPRLDSIDFKRMTVGRDGAGSNPEDLYSACPDNNRNVTARTQRPRRQNSLD